MLAPLFDNPRRKKVADIKNFPAPIGGWASDNAAEADSLFTARILRNLVPNQKTAFIRGGSGVISTIAGTVNTLMSYKSGATTKLLAAASDKVFEIPFTGAIPGAAPIELASGKSNSKWQYVSATNAADAVNLLCVNGADGMHKYDGATFVKHVITTNDKLTFNNITTFKGRVWCTDLNSSVVYYGEPLSNAPVNMTAFPVGPFLRKGGSIVQINSLSVDGGSGPHDYLVMVSDRGEILMYQGIDPADDFGLAGVYNVSKPLGLRCLQKVGKDLVYFGESGPEYLSQLLPAAQTVGSALIVNVRTEFEEQIFKNNLAFGWDFVLYSRRSWVLFNIPLAPPVTMAQYCINLETNAWFEITDWNALCWVQHLNNIIFGDANGAIVVADFGGNDRGSAINIDYMQSWYEFGTAAKKKFNMAQMTIKSNVIPDISVDIMVDYEEVLPASTPAFALKAAVSPWNVSPWNISPWSGTDSFYVNQFGLGDIGYVGALRYRGSLIDSTHELYGFRIAFEEGEIL